MAKLTEDNSPQRTEPASRRPVLDYFPEMGNRLTRFLSSREKMVDGMKTLAWVVPLTLLIWIYAEREQVVVPTSPNANGVSINITSSDASRYVEPVNSPELTPTVNLLLSGPQQAVARVQNLLSMRIPHERLPIDIKSRIGLNQQVNIVQAIQDLPIFKDNGVTVQQSQPAELYVNIYKMSQHEVTVLIPPTITNLTPETRFTPTKVIVSGPEGLLAPDLKVYAKLEDYEQIKQPGQHTIQSVPLEFIPAQPKLSVSPNTVTANTVVVASDVSYEIPDTLPLYYQAPGTTLSRFEVTLTNAADITIANIHVTGTQQGIDAIKNKTFTVKPILNVEPGDQFKDVTRNLTYQLPDGVHPTEEEKNRTVEFRLTQR